MKGGEAMLYEGDLIGEFKLPENDHRALVITDGNDDYVILKSKTTTDEIEGAEYWGLLARGRDGHTPSMDIGANGHWIIDGKDSGHEARGPVGSLGNPTTLTGTFDLNKQTTPGIYIAANGTVSHAPDGFSDQFTMLVIGSQDIITQYLHGTGKNELWIRGKSATNDWTDWRQITQWN